MFTAHGAVLRCCTRAPAHYEYMHQCTTTSYLPTTLHVLVLRSPSPEPIYSSDGKRLNTREYRKRKELEETRHNAIQRMIEINAEYKPPADYK